VTLDWRQGLPAIHGPSVTLREPRMADAAALHARLTTPPVTRFVSTPPSSPEGFERFISWVQNERNVGRHVCFAIIPDGTNEAAGLVQVREIDAGFGTAEWGFALGESHWGTGLFMTCAGLVLDFAFRHMRVHRLEARVSVSNGRGNGILHKLGAVPEGILRQSFANHALRSDQILWSIIADDWLALHPDPAFLVDHQVVQAPETVCAVARTSAAPWRSGLPSLLAPGLTLRELIPEDADTLTSLFSDAEVGKYISAPPATANDFTRFIQWAHDQRKSGTVLCFGVVPESSDAAVGIFQLHEREVPFRTAEWGFVIGRPYWGTGLFEHSAQRFLQFAFETVGVHRLEARAIAGNARANAVLGRLGATEEGHLRRSFLLGGEYHDDVLWAMLESDWRMRQNPASVPSQNFGEQ
jgi:ribosomal-protein-alanine N-acetyltransferase